MTALLVLTVDQASKSLAVTMSRADEGIGPLSVRVVRNSGASFGIGAGHPLVITLTVTLVLAVMLVPLCRTRTRTVALSLATVIGGAAGNLADRLFRGPTLGRGSVVDWIHVAIYPATFNLADVAIRLGALCALIAYLLTERRSRARVRTTLRQ